MPKTGCWEGVLLSNQSRKELCTVLMKNWDPPLLGAPVLAIEKVLRDEGGAMDKRRIKRKDRN